MQRLRYVTLPTISPVILFAVVLGVIQALQYFTQAYVAATSPRARRRRPGPSSTLELGYPEGSTLFYPILLYYHGFRFFNMGYASAMAMLLLVVAFAVTSLIIRGSSRRWVHYRERRGERRRGRLERTARSAGRCPRSIRRRRFLIAIADHSLLIVAGDRVPGAGRLHRR